MDPFWSFAVAAVVFMIIGLVFHFARERAWAKQIAEERLTRSGPERVAPAE
jgi:hypothetical protein